MLDCTPPHKKYGTDAENRKIFKSLKLGEKTLYWLKIIFSLVLDYFF